MHDWPTSVVAGATQRMKCCSRNFNEHEGEFDVRGAAEARTGQTQLLTATA
jgi:hypothetical protein